MITQPSLRDKHQIKIQGWSENGWLSKSYVDKLIVSPCFLNMIYKREAIGGKFMTAIKEVKKTIEENTDAISSASTHLVETAREANRQMAEVSGKFRDGTDKLSSAIDKMMKVAGRADFNKAVDQTIILVDALERLAALEEKGVLEKLTRALK